MSAYKRYRTTARRTGNQVGVSPWRRPRNTPSSTQRRSLESGRHRFPGTVDELTAARGRGFARLRVVGRRPAVDDEIYIKDTCLAGERADGRTKEEKME